MTCQPEIPIVGQKHESAHRVDHISASLEVCSLLEGVK